MLPGTFDYEIVNFGANTHTIFCVGVFCCFCLFLGESGRMDTNNVDKRRDAVKRWKENAVDRNGN